MKAGRNVFFTGNAGTGKVLIWTQCCLILMSIRCGDSFADGCPPLQSFLLNAVIEHFQQRYGDEFTSCVGITAATGIAATHIGGQGPFADAVHVNHEPMQTTVMRWMHALTISAHASQAPRFTLSRAAACPRCTPTS